MKPLALTLQLVLGQDDRRMYAEIEVVFEDGTTILRKIPVNTRLHLDFQELLKEGADANTTGGE